MSFLLACTLVLPDQPSSSKLRAMVLSAAGAVTLERDSGKSRPLEAGWLLRDGDRLKIAGEGEATLIFFGDRDHRERVKPNTAIVVREKGCDPADAVERVKAARPLSRAHLSGLRELSDHHDRIGVKVLRNRLPAIPPAVTPMYGASVVGRHPILAWPPAAGAAGYRVCLLSGREGDDEPLWQASTNEARLAVTDEGPLEEGKKYRWRVYALEKGGEERVLVESHFFLCASELEAADWAGLAQLATSPAPGDWLLAAAVYEGYGVYDQALPLYERLAKEMPDAAEIQAALACYYWRAGRPEKAREARERAEKLGAKVPAM